MQIQANSTIPVTPTSEASEQVKRYVDAVYAHDDRVELRGFADGKGRKITFTAANQVAAWLSRLYALQRNESLNVGIGLNPRSRDGSKNEDVARANTLLLDFDSTDLQTVRSTWERMGLPRPTLTVESGRGIHLYLRFETPQLDLAEWSRLQQIAAEATGADPKVKDPARIIRLPGTYNLRTVPPSLCQIVAHEPVTYPFGELLALFQKRTPKGAAITLASNQGTVVQSTESLCPALTNEALLKAVSGPTRQYLQTATPEGNRNNALFKAALELKRVGLRHEKAAAILVQCSRRDGLADAESDQTVRSAFRYEVKEVSSNPRAAIEASQCAEGDCSDDGRPIVLLNDNRGRDTLDTIERIVTGANSTDFLRFGDVLVALKEQSSSEGPKFSIQPHDADTLDASLTRLVNFRRGGEKSRPMPASLNAKFARSFLKLEQCDVPRLRAIVRGPVLAPDRSSLVSKRGWDSNSGLCVSMDDLPLSFPASPSEADVAHARRLLIEELLADFQFADDDGASLANAIALMLSPIVRPAIEGPMPLELVEASVEGTGKTLLAKLTKVPAIGDAISVLPLPDGESERQKVVLAELLRSQPAVLWDNVCEIDSSTIALLHTAREYSGRILGRSQMASLPNLPIWMATGNNVQLSPEISRRTVTVRLQARQERPSDRAAFRHPLPRWAFEKRAVLLDALLTLVQRWITRGRPKGKETFGSFEAYAEVMGGILEVASIPGFLQNRSLSRQKSSPLEEEWKAFFRQVHGKFGGDAFLTREVVAHVLAYNGDLLMHTIGEHASGNLCQRLGIAMRKMLGRVYGGCRLDQVGTDGRSGQPKWKVVKVMDQTVLS